MSLERVLETEAMDSLEEALDYDQMDHFDVNRAFVDELLAWGPIHAEILDVGTGTARIPIELCVHNERGCVLAVDLSVNMLDIARNNVELASLTDRIMLDRIDAKRLPYEIGRFEAVISNSLVHHIPEPFPVLAELVRVTARGGLVFVRDLLRPNNDSDLDGLVEEYAGDENAHARQMFRDSLRAALDLAEIRALVQQLGFDADSVQATSDRHWTWATPTTGEETPL